MRKFWRRLCNTIVLESRGICSLHLVSRTYYTSSKVVGLQTRHDRPVCPKCYDEEQDMIAERNRKQRLDSERRIAELKAL